MEIEEHDFLKALQEWYWSLNEMNNLDDKEFNDMLKKYNLTLKDIGIDRSVRI